MNRKILGAIAVTAAVTGGLYACGGDDNVNTGDSGTGDGGGPDSTTTDSNVPDSGTRDNNAPDNNVPDNNVPDNNVADNNVPDTNTPDVAPDAPAADAQPDAETDAGCPASWLVPPTIDDAGAGIDVPADGGTVILHGAATGTQDYTCTGSDAGVPDGGDAGSLYAWTFTGPQATLVDCNGTTVAIHSAPTGPTHPQWASTDGSIVVGHKLAAFTPDPTAVPWLLLSAASTSGTGIMNGVLYIQRLNTTGGIAPTTTCDATNVGTTSNVNYTADYYFWGN